MRLSLYLPKLPSIVASPYSFNLCCVDLDAFSKLTLGFDILVMLKGRPLWLHTVIVSPSWLSFLLANFENTLSSSLIKGSSTGFKRVAFKVISFLNAGESSTVVTLIEVVCVC